MDFINYYKSLGLEPKASQDDIKKAYRKLARKYHPDLNPNNADAKLNFQRINEANSVLSNPEKRKKYDQYGKDWEHSDKFESNKSTSSSNQRTSRGSQYQGDYSDFFESMFNGSASQGRQVKFRGEDFQASLRLTLLDAYKTHQQTLTVNGKSIRITIPAGIGDGQTIKIKNHGGLGMNGGPNGDLYISFSIDNHSVFNRLKNDLYITADLSLYTAVLGGEFIIETMDGKVKLKVQPETQNGMKVKLKGKGFPVYKKEGEFGDLYVTYNIKIPTGLTEQQKKLFNELSTI